MTSAADITPLYGVLLGAQWRMVQVIKVTQSDWISLENVKGVIAVVGAAQSTSAAAAETPTYGTVTINNKGTAYTATDTSIVVDGGKATRLPPYYLLSASGEILEVTAETAPATAAGTLTVKRGCLGTTASLTGLADDNVLSVLNQIVLGASTVGGVLLGVCVMPDDPGTKMGS